MTTPPQAPVRASRPLALLMSLLLLGGSHDSASASVAPTTPTFLLAWGTLGSAGGQFNAPGAVTTDALGNVYVVDTGNSRIETFDNQGHYLARWGSLGSAPPLFNRPSGIALDASGYVYVTDTGNNRVKQTTSTGTLVHQWGSLGSGPGQFSTPNGIALDASGNIYVSDSLDRVQKFAPGGAFILQWGATGTGDGQLRSPAGLVVDASGNVLVADRLNHRIQKFSNTGVYVSQFGTSGSAAGQLSLPNGIALDVLGNIYVSELGNSRVQKFSAAGTSLTSWGTLGSSTGQFDQPKGIAVDAEGNVFVADANNARLQKFSGAGAVLSQVTPAFSASFGSAGSGNGQFNTPYAVTTDGSGWVYVADTWNRRVQKFSGNGVFNLKFGTQGTLPGQFDLVNGVATDPSGNVYATSQDNRVEVFNSAGAYQLQWGAAGAGAGQFNVPFGIAVDPATLSVLVADANNNRIQKFTVGGSYISQWGTTGSGPGQFNGPRGIAVDRAGNVYVTDGNSRVQKFTTAGVFVTQWAVTYSIASVAVDGQGDVYVCNAGPSANIQKFRSDGTLLAQWGSYGTGNGQFSPPYGLCVDVTGNVYVADYGGNRVVKFVTPPAITYVSDVGNDQGRQVRLRIQGASVDAPANGGVTGYAVYRRVDLLPLAAPSSATSAGAIGPDAVQLAGWDYLGTQPAAGDPEYSMIVPTLANANAASTYYSAYLVRALTSDPLTHYDSFVENGYSIDNLSPPAPTPASAPYMASATHLHWGISSASDFATFRVYKGASAGFVPGPGSLLAATTDTGYVDVGPVGSYYKLSAVDFNGNESAFTLVQSQQTTSVGATPTLAFALDGVRPNPASGRSLVTFAVPRRAHVRVTLLDVQGREVAVLADGVREAGRYTEALQAGALHAGMYFVRMQAPGVQLTRRVAVVR